MISRLKEALKGRVFIQSILVGMLGVISAFFYNISDLLSATPEELELVVNQFGSQLSSLLISSSISTFFMVFIAYLVGYKCRKVINLKTNKMDKRDVVISYLSIVSISVILFALDYLVYNNNINNFSPIIFNPIELSVSLLHTGVVEEILFRYGLTSFLIFLLYNIFSKRDEKTGKKGAITKGIVIAGIIFSCSFLFAFQLTSIIDLYGKAFLVILRSVINYYVIGLLLNYVYVKYGLKWSILLHVSFVLMYTGICPLILYLVLV